MYEWRNKAHIYCIFINASLVSWTNIQTPSNFKALSTDDGAEIVYFLNALKTEPKAEKQGTM